MSFYKKSFLVITGLSALVLISAGWGGNEWGSTRPVYGGIHVHDNAGSQDIPTGATYAKITSFSDNCPSNVIIPDATNNKITITKPGKYFVNGAFSFSSGTNNVTFFGSPFLSGVEQDQLHWTRKISVAGDVGSASFSGILTATTVPIDVDVRFRHDDLGTVAVTVSYANFSLFFLGD